MVKEPNERTEEEKNTRLKKEKKPHADEPLHSMDGDVDTEAPEEHVTEFKTKVNKYGFIHVPKKARLSLPFKIEETLKVQIAGDHIIIAAAAEN